MSKFKSEMTGGWKSVALGAGVAGAVAAGVAAKIGVDAVKSYGSYQAAATQAGNSAGMTAKQTQAVSDKLLTMGHIGESSSNQLMAAYAPVAGQLRTVQGAALNANQTISDMKATTDLSEASTTSLSNAQADLGGVMLATSTKIDGVSKVANVLYNMSRKTGVGVDQLSQGINRMRPYLAGTGIGISQLGGVMLDMVTHFGTGRKAIMGTGTMIQHLTQPTAAASTLMSYLGVKTHDAAGKFLGLNTVLNELHGFMTKNLTAQDKMNLALDVYGKTGAAAHDKDSAALLKEAAMQKLFSSSAGQANVLISQGASGLDKYTQSVVHSGTAATAAAKVQQTQAGQMKVLHAAVSGASTAIGAALAPAVEKLLRWVTPLITQIAAWISQHRTLAAIILGSIFAVGALTAVVVTLGFAFTALSGPIGITVLALTGLAVGIGYLISRGSDWANSNKQTIQSEQNLTNAMQGEHDAAQQLLSSRRQLAGDANSIADAKLAHERALVTLHTTHAAKGSLDYREASQQVKDTLQGVHQAEQQHRDDLASVHTNILKAAQAHRELKTSLDKNLVSQVLQIETGVITNKNTKDYVKALHSQAEEFKNTNPLLSHNLDLLAQYAVNVGGFKNMKIPVIKAIVDTTSAKKQLDQIKGYGTSTPNEGPKPKSQGPFYTQWWQQIQDIFHHAIDKISQMLETGWARMREKVEYFWTLIEDTLQTWWNQISDAAESWGSGLTSYFTGLWGDITSGVSSGWGAVETFFQGLGSQILTWIGDPLTWLSNLGLSILTGLWNGIVTAWTTVSGWFSAIGSWVSTAVGDAAKWLLSKGGDVLTGLWNGISGAAGWLGTQVGAVAGWIQNGVGNALQWLSGKGLPALTGLWNGISDAAGWLEGKLDAAAGWVQTGVGNALTWLKDKGENVLTGLWNGIVAAWTTAKADYKKVKGWVQTATGTGLTWLKDTGVNIMDGLWNGMKTEWDKVKSWIGGLKGWIESHMSPVSVDQALLQPSGVAMMQGLSMGLASQIPNLQSTLGTIKGTIAGNGSASLGSSLSSSGVSVGSSGGGSQIVFNITGNMLTDGPAIDLLTNKIGAKLAGFGISAAGIQIKQ